MAPSLIQFVIPGAPQGKGRARAATINGHARMFTPQKTAAYESTVRLAAHQAMAGRPLIDSAVQCWLNVFCEIPASWSRKRRQQAIRGELKPTGRPDIDNVAKAILDGCNGVLWRDDVLVVDLSVRKRYAATPCVLVEVWASVALRPVRQTHTPIMSLRECMEAEGAQ